jgi:tetratricopeptide (TPR) repeat protein
MLSAGHIITRKLDDEIPSNILEWMVEIGEFAAENKAMKNLVRINMDYINEIYNTAIEYGNYSVALVAADAEIKLRPEAYEALINKGNCYLNLNFTNKAMDAFEEANIIKETPGAWNGIKKIWVLRADYDKVQIAKEQAEALLHQEYEDNYISSQ